MLLLDVTKLTYFIYNIKTTGLPTVLHTIAVSYSKGILYYYLGVHFHGYKASHANKLMF